MLSKQNETQIQVWFAERGCFKLHSVKWKNYNDLLGRRLLDIYQFFIQTCKYDWNRKYKIDLDECESMLAYGLIKAMGSYGSNKHGVFTGCFKCNFSTFYWYLAKRLLSNYLVKASHKKPSQARNFKFKAVQKRIPPHLLMSTDSIGINGRFKQFPYRLDEVGSMTDYQRDILQQVFQKCSFKQKKILIWLYRGMTQKEIANKLDVSNQRISTLLKELRKEMGLLDEYKVNT